MGEPVEIFLGFDPGGANPGERYGNFGWSVCQDAAGQFQIFDTGLARYAEQAIDQVLRSLPDNTCVLAAVGIEAPMFWHKTGHREIDGFLREEVERWGCPHPWGTIQPVNSLWGACLAQGIMLGRGLHERDWFKSPITEANSKALRWLKPATFYYIQRLTEGEGKSDHERDATLAAYGAWAMRRNLYGWRDLFEDEQEPYPILEQQVSYWMPIPERPPA